MDKEITRDMLKDKLQKVSIDIDENNLNYLLQNADQQCYYWGQKG